MRPFFYLVLTALSLLLSQCKTASKSGAAGATKPADAAAGPAPELSFLLSMSYDEASAISPQKLVVAPFAKIAADSIEVVSKKADGTPRKVRAKGHVFVQMDYREEARALCQEALISGDEVILRGRPIVQRGTSTVEGLADSTVFFMMGLRLRAIGLHKVSNASSLGGSGPWANNANPLLPPLEESAVPNDIRDELRKAADAEALHQSALKNAPAPPLPTLQ